MTSVTMSNERTMAAPPFRISLRMRSSMLGRTAPSNEPIYSQACNQQSRRTEAPKDKQLEQDIFAMNEHQLLKCRGTPNGRHVSGERDNSRKRACPP